MEKPEYEKIYFDPYRSIQLVGTNIYFDGFSPTKEGIEGQKEVFKSQLAHQLAAHLTQHMTFQIYEEENGYRMVATMGIYPLTPEEQEKQKKYVDEYFSALQKEQERIVDAIIKARGE